METIKAVWAFIWLWGSRVSGAIAIPFFWYGASHGLTNGVAYLYTSFVALAACAIGQGAKLFQLERKFKPSLRLACSEGVEGCVSIAQDASYVAYRLRVVNAGLDEIVGCEARLVSITDDHGIKWSGDVAVLTFAPAEGGDAEHKTLRSKVPYWLDIIFVTQDREIKMGTKGSLWRFIPPLRFFGTKAATTYALNLPPWADQCRPCKPLFSLIGMATTSALLSFS